MSTTNMPLFCPECGNLMNKKLDKKMWNFHNKCLDCVTREHSLKVENGEWKEYSKEIIEKNIVSYLNSQKKYLKEYLLVLDKIEFVQNSSGDIEKWDINPEKIKQIKKQYEGNLEEVEEYLNKIKKEGK